LSLGLLLHLRVRVASYGGSSRSLSLCCRVHGLLLDGSLLLLYWPLGRRVSLSVELHGSQLLCELTIGTVHSCGSDIGISLNNFQRVLQDIDSRVQLLSSLSHTWGLSQHAGDSLVGVNSVPQLLVQFILSFRYQEVSNLLRDSVTDRSQHNSEVLIESSSNFLDESGLSADWCHVYDRLAVLIQLRRNLDLLVLLEMEVVSEDVVLLSIDNSLHYSGGVVSLFLHHSSNDLNNLRLE